MLEGVASPTRFESTVTTGTNLENWISCLPAGEPNTPEIGRNPLISRRWTFEADDWHDLYWDTLRGSLRKVSAALTQELAVVPPQLTSN